MQVDGLSALVTGAASGLGLAAAKALKMAGAKVALLDRDEEKVSLAANEIGGVGIACDVTDPDALVEALAKAERKNGPIRINVNCAGIPGGMRLVGRDGPVDMAAFASVIDINLMGTVSVMTKCAARMMALETLNDDGERGIIINTGSITAVEGQIGQGAYVASKGAIASLTLQAAREFMPRGIRVMTIAPGLFKTANCRSHSSGGHRRHAGRADVSQQVWRTGRVRSPRRRHRAQPDAEWRDHTSGRRRPASGAISLPDLLVFGVVLGGFDEPGTELPCIWMIAARFGRNQIECLVQRRFDLEWAEQTTALDFNAKHRRSRQGHAAAARREFERQ